MNRKLTVFGPALMVLLLAISCGKKEDADISGTPPMPSPPVKNAPSLADYLRADQIILLENGPGSVALESIHQLIPPGVRLSFVVDLRPFQRTRLSGKIMDAIPASYLDEYREWLQDTGFNPLEQTIGGAMWANTDDYNSFAHPGTDSRAVVILKNAPLLDLLEKSMNDKDEDADQKDPKRKDGEFALLSELGEDTIDVIAEMNEKDPTNLLNMRLSDRTSIGVFSRDEVVAYVYAYPRGVIVGMTPKGKEEPVKLALTKAYAFAKAIDNASRSDSARPLDHTLAFHIPFPEGDAAITVDLNEAAIKTMMLFPYAMVGGQENMKTASENIWMIRSNASTLVEQMVQGGKISRSLAPLIEMIIKNVNIEATPAAAKITFEVHQSDVVSLLEAL